jgi:hypothetical protein
VSLDQPVTPSPQQQGYPQQPGYPQPEQPGYPQQPGFPPPPGGYPPPPMPAQQQGFSGLAIAGFILSFFGGLLGFVLSLIAIFMTGKGKKRGRGLAIAGVIISVVVTILGIIIVVVIASKATVIDPGCTTGKNAILNNATNVTPDSVQATIDGLNSAASEAKNDDVRAAMKTMAGDYSELLKAMNTGKVPDGLLQKITTDANAVDALCTI